MSAQKRTREVGKGLDALFGDVEIAPIDRNIVMESRGRTETERAVSKKDCGGRGCSLYRYKQH